MGSLQRLHEWYSSMSVLVGSCHTRCVSGENGHEMTMA
jgi:hypothetical protein